MDIKTMIDSHREMIDTMAASLKERGFDKALLRRPVELHEERAAGIKARIHALESARRDYVAKVDGDIKTLNSELAMIEARIKTEREHVATVMKPTGAKSALDRTMSGARPASTAESKTAAPASGKRPAKARPAKAAAKRPKPKVSASNKRSTGKSHSKSRNS